MGTGSQRLQRDHQGLTEKLATLQDEIGLYDDELHETDIHRVLETLEFINSYPQACHHPLEEAAMEFLRDQGVELPPEFDHIHQQHEDHQHQQGREGIHIPRPDVGGASASTPGTDHDRSFSLSTRSTRLVTPVSHSSRPS